MIVSTQLISCSPSCHSSTLPLVKAQNFPSLLHILDLHRAPAFANSASWILNFEFFSVKQCYSIFCVVFAECHSALLPCSLLTPEICCCALLFEASSLYMPNSPDAFCWGQMMYASSSQHVTHGPIMHSLSHSTYHLLSIARVCVLWHFLIQNNRGHWC